MKKEVKILGLSYSQSQSGSYVLVLAEKKGKRKIPIIIKPNDAQQIALKMEGVKPPRPLTHDLFKALTDNFGIDLVEVYIHEVLEGVFYTKLITTNGMDEIEIECNVGDGVALAQIYGCPIYVSKSVIETSGIYINDDGTTMSKSEIENSEEVEITEVKPKKSKKRAVSVQDLEKMMNDAISNEEYEIAAELRDRIAKIKSETQK